jgi:hypothetical protein
MIPPMHAGFVILKEPSNMGLNNVEQGLGL